MSEDREYLIRKGGYYYRPDCQGYTTRKVEAGRYTKAEADAEAAVEPWHMSAIHQDEIPDEPEIIDRDKRIEAEIAARRALQAVGPEPAVAVKPLIWNVLGFAHTNTGIMYRVTRQPGYWRLEKIEGSSTLNSSHPTEETAKAAAEADYASRIRSALVATPPAERSADPAFEAAPHNGTPHEVLSYLLDCAKRWVPEARIIGNARAGDIERALEATLTPPADSGVPPCWWIDHGSHGQITQREDEASRAIAEGKRVVRYTASIATPPAERVVDADAVREALLDAKAKLRMAFRKALSELPEIAPTEIKSVLSSVHMREEFINEGKRLQLEHGTDAVAPRVEQECGAGAWSFMRSGVLTALAAKDGRS